MQRTSIARDAVRRNGESGVASVTAAPGSSIVIGGTPTNPVIGSSTVAGAGGVDRRYYVVGTSVPGKTTPPDWDRYNVWGLEKGYGSTAADGLAPDKMQAIPCWFNRTGTINKIIGMFSTNAGFPATFLFAIYANYADGMVWPGAKLAQMAAITIDSVGSSQVVQWTADLPVKAGDLLWLATSVGGSTVFNVGRSAPATDFPCIMGSVTFGTAGAPPGGFDPTPCAAIKSVDSVYNSVAPAIFPVTNPVLALGTAVATDSLPLHAFRFVL